MDKMKHLLLGTAVAAGIALAGGSAYAADIAKPGVVEAPAPAAMSGVYVSVFGGYAASMTANGTYTTNGADFSMPFNSGYVIGGAIGMEVAPNLRAELEASYVAHDVSGTITATLGGGSQTFPATGTGSTLYVLGNAWYDIPMGGSITPYLGGGVGLAVVMPNLSFVGAPGGTYDTDAVALAAQLGAGIKFQVSDNIALDLGYRAKGVFNASLTGTGTDGDLKALHYIDQTVQVGLDVGF